MTKNTPEYWAGLSDEDLVSSLSIEITGASVTGNQDLVDLGSIEVQRRGKSWLYAKAWNKAYEEQGHKLTPEMRHAAQVPMEVAS